MEFPLVHAGPFWDISCYLVETSRSTWNRARTVACVKMLIATRTRYNAQNWSATGIYIQSFRSSIKASYYVKWALLGLTCRCNVSKTAPHQHIGYESLVNDKVIPESSLSNRKDLGSWALAAGSCLWSVALRAWLGNFTIEQRWRSIGRAS